jgi:hypothetical protein
MISVHYGTTKVSAKGNPGREDKLLGELKSVSKLHFVDRLGELGARKVVTDTVLDSGGSGQSERLQNFFQEVGLVKHKVASIQRNVNFVPQVLIASIAVSISEMFTIFAQIFEEVCTSTSRSNKQLLYQVPARQIVASLHRIDTSASPLLPRKWRAKNQNRRAKDQNRRAKDQNWRA